jgi:hypothetical protein
MLEGQVLALVGDVLTQSGWMRIAQEPRFASRLNADIEARLNYAFAHYTQPARVHVTPYVEVFHRGIEEARNFITGRTLYTVNEQIQRLMNDPRAHYRWMFVDGEDMEAVASGLAADCLQYAPSFFSQFNTLDDIIQYLELRAKGKRTIMRQSLAIAYCRAGRLGDARQVLGDDVAAARSNPLDIASEQLPRYTELYGLRFD